MAKKIYKAPKHFTGSTITTKTHFGSHKEMVVDDVTNANVTLSSNQVVCMDDRGYYLTTVDRIDSGLADPNRYSDSNRVSVFFKEETQEVDNVQSIQ